jgi:hypothetical protein
MTYTHTGVVTINATATVVTSGKNFSELNVNGSGITVTLGDALNIQTPQFDDNSGNIHDRKLQCDCGGIVLKQFKYSDNYLGIEYSHVVCYERSRTTQQQRT